ncbi:MAG: 2'-5' RNA ligase [Elusimicrobia bacterium RIFCSPHIGHO2_01_FULL_64_10]|nr:MAG: 2'-5' RNA ligase [Elusimicrobia bacterium RIFCSPHIGHO2_01_FULL_64_10]
MRLFAAVAIPPEIREAVARLRDGWLRSPEAPKGARRVKPANLHLTLKFFGEVPETLVPALSGALERSVRGRKKFTLALGGTGFFPEKGRPRVLWLGVPDPAQSGALTDLAAAVERETLSSGFPPADRSFSPHLTLARLEAPPGPGFEKVLGETSGRIVAETAVDRIFLIESRLRPGGAGPEYQDVSAHVFDDH